MSLLCSQLQMCTSFIVSWGVLVACSWLRLCSQLVLAVCCCDLQPGVFPPSPSGWVQLQSPRQVSLCFGLIPYSCFCAVLSVYRSTQASLARGFQRWRCSISKTAAKFGCGCGSRVKGRRAKVQRTCCSAVLSGTDCANLTDQGRGDRRCRNIS